MTLKEKTQQRLKGTTTRTSHFINGGSLKISSAVPFLTHNCDINNKHAELGLMGKLFRLETPSIKIVFTLGYLLNLWHGLHQTLLEMLRVGEEGSNLALAKSILAIKVLRRLVVQGLKRPQDNTEV